jgi:hypothetical protein
MGWFLLSRLRLLPPRLCTRILSGNVDLGGKRISSHLLPYTSLGLHGILHHRRREEIDLQGNVSVTPIHHTTVLK